MPRPDRGILFGRSKKIARSEAGNDETWGEAGAVVLEPVLFQLFIKGLRVFRDALQVRGKRRGLRWRACKTG